MSKAMRSGPPGRIPRDLSLAGAGLAETPGGEEDSHLVTSSWDGGRGAGRGGLAPALREAVEALLDS